MSLEGLTISRTNTPVSGSPPPVERALNTTNFWVLIDAELYEAKVSSGSIFPSASGIVSALFTTICHSSAALSIHSSLLVLSLSDESQRMPSPEYANRRSAVLPITRLMQILVQRFERDNIGQNFDLPEWSWADTPFELKHETASTESRANLLTIMVKIGYGVMILLLGTLIGCIISNMILLCYGSILFFIGTYKNEFSSRRTSY